MFLSFRSITALTTQNRTQRMMPGTRVDMKQERTESPVLHATMIISELGGMSRPSMDEFANSAPMNPLLYPDSFMRGVRIDPMQHIVAAAEPVSAPNTAQVIELT